MPHAGLDGGGDAEHRGAGVGLATGDDAEHAAGVLVVGRPRAPARARRRRRGRGGARPARRRPRGRCRRRSAARRPARSAGSRCTGLATEKVTVSSAKTPSGSSSPPIGSWPEGRSTAMTWARLGERREPADRPVGQPRAARRCRGCRRARRRPPPSAARVGRRARRPAASAAARAPSCTWSWCTATAFQPASARRATAYSASAPLLPGPDERRDGLAAALLEPGGRDPGEPLDGARHQLAVVEGRHERAPRRRRRHPSTRPRSRSRVLPRRRRPTRCRRRGTGTGAAR